MGFSLIKTLKSVFKKIFSLLAVLAVGYQVQAQQAPALTTNTGALVGSNQYSKTAGENGPVLLEDVHLLEKISAFDRERTPERVVHARGTGAYGEFVSYGDFSQYTKASVFGAKDKKTPLFTRFSTVIHGKDSPETVRDPRGFAVKLYTDQGNYDIVGNDLPVFFIRDAMKFPDMVHALKPSPVYNRQDANRVFDFFSNIPEATNMFTYLYSDLGTPAGYRHMDGFGVHAFKWVNAQGQVTYVKYKWSTLQGVKSLSREEIGKMQSQDFQYATTDLYASIGKGDFPAWELSVQMLKPEDLNKFDFNPLDATKIWPENLAPSTKIGKMTLNRMPTNYFDETEQSAFSPGTLVPGIEPSEDKLLQGRVFSYFDTQRYRIGANFQQLPINAPKVAVENHNQDGSMSYHKSTSNVNYQPSTTHPTEGFVDSPAQEYSRTPLVGTTTQIKIHNNNDFAQAGVLYRSLSEKDKQHLIGNLVADLSNVQNKVIVYKMVNFFYQADADYGQRLMKALKLEMKDVMSVAKN